MVNDRIIRTEKIIRELEEHFFEIINNDDYYKGYKIKIANEQFFVREKEPETLYIVFKLGTTEINYDQTAVPITLVAISERNGVNVCQNLLMDFVQKYNLQWNKDKTIKEFWQTPTVISNFEELYDGFRSTLYTTGTFLITEKANFFELQYLGYKVLSNNEEISKTAKFKSSYWFERFKDLQLLGQKIVYKFDAESQDTSAKIKDLNLLKKAIRKLQINNKTLLFEYKILAPDLDDATPHWYLNNQYIDLDESGIEYTSEPQYKNEREHSRFMVNILEDGWYMGNNETNPENFEIIINDEIVNNLDYIEIEKEWIEVNSISTTTGASVNIDSQVFYNSNNFVDSIGMYGSKVISVSIYSFDDDFCNKCLSIYLEDLEEQPDGVDTKFYFKLKFKNGKEKEDIYKMTGYTITSNLGEIPLVSLSFAK